MELLVYLDEAGHSRNTPTVVVAGFAGNNTQWSAVESEWRAALEHSRVSTFHMKDFENRFGEFRDWDELTQKRPLMETLVGSIQRNELIAVGAAVSVSWFNALDRGEYPEHKFFEDPYHLALQEVVHVLGQEVVPHERATSVAVTLAEQPEYQGQGRGYYAAAAALMYPSTFVPDVKCDSPATNVRIQAADLVAYELRKFCDNPAVLRWPMRQLRKNSHVFASKGFPLAELFGEDGSPYPERYYVMKMNKNSR